MKGVKFLELCVLNTLLKALWYVKTLLNQITTISKQRIYYPKTSKDLLAGLHLSNSSLDLLDKKMSY